MNIKIVKQTLIPKEARAGIIAAYLKRLTSREVDFKRRLIALFEHQKEDVLRHLPNIFNPRGASLNIQYFGRRQKAVEDVVFDVASQVRVFASFENPILVDTLLAAAREVFGMTGENPNVIDLQKTRITDYLRQQTQKFAEKVNDTTARALRAELSAGLASGESLSDLKARVEKVYGEATGFRAERIARTEIGSANNFGEQEAYLQSEIVIGKEWATVIDDRTRGEKPADEFNHVMMDGVVVGRDEAFDVDGESLMFPRDPAGSAGNIINCRCRTFPVYR